MTSEHSKRMIRVATRAGKIMLSRGAETYRVEDTVYRMAQCASIEDINVFIIPTGILFSAQVDGEVFTLLERVYPQGIDLEIIDRVNAFSRQFTSGALSVETAEQQLRALDAPPTFSLRTRLLGAGLGGGFFVAMFNGTPFEMLLGFLASVVVMAVMEPLSIKKLNFFIRNMIGGMVAALSGLICVLIFNEMASLNVIIIGPIMTLVPGVPLTNGIRDLISGELLSGSAKMMEALFVAIALAFGVGVILQLGLHFV